ncbi:LysR family transcriptional regulator [Burkholderia cenocepacia]|uniref:LysR family transcriptional regulator n=1 Tax=Burkholderia cenocepacia TaxID=95486 RepID=UPI0038B7B6DC
MSFTRAGQELNVTQSAVSRQVKALEEQLRIELFHRHIRSLTLTDKGASCTTRSRSRCPIWNRWSASCRRASASAPFRCRPPFRSPRCG